MWSPAARWSMGLLKAEDWKAQWISFKDETPLPKDGKVLHLPPARHYRKALDIKRGVKRATVYMSALGIADLYIDGFPISGAHPGIGAEYFAPGWSDYAERAYYRAYDVTSLLDDNRNSAPMIGETRPHMIGAVVADGWYAGYVGYGLLVGYGPNKTGCNIYGKTPALLAQLQIEYADGSRETIGTDATWQTSGDGPYREADLLMGETYDAQRDSKLWCINHPKADAEDAWKWEPAIRAEDNGSVQAKFFEPGVAKEVELGFQQPKRLAAYTAPPIRCTQGVAPAKIKEIKPGVWIFDFGQNFAGNVILNVKGQPGTKITLRYGEMLHPDGSLMTENLRRARATDTYIIGAIGGGRWSPRFTYHGFRYVEVSGLPEKPDDNTLTGQVIHNDTPMLRDYDHQPENTFACSDEVMTQFWKNTVWTQRANFIEVPTDCPQRDERLGWMGDAQIYARTATYNADVAAFFTKWVDDVREAQRPQGPYPDYAPYPFAHGKPGATHGTAWTDAGIIVPYTMWQVYDDRRLIEKHWDSMARFMDWRAKADPELKGVNLGNPWGDWLNVGETTPIEFIDLCYHFSSSQKMAELARMLKKEDAALEYSTRCGSLAKSFARQFIKADGSLSVETQSAAVLAISSGILNLLQVQEQKPFISPVAQTLVDRIAKNDFRMATGFLGTKPLLTVLTNNGQHDLAARLFQSRKFPSWGYEVEQGATSVWERWDSFTKEHGFNGATGKNNAAMNSFSHYAFGAVMEWGFQSLAGIGCSRPGFKVLSLHPEPPSAKSNPDGKPLDWVRAEYNHPRGKIVSAWKREGNAMTYDFTIPANVSAEVQIPATRENEILMDGQPFPKSIPRELGRNGNTSFTLGSGTYHFEVR